jgi:triphosphoribosyl-dephospho-CoA synthase
MVSIGLFAQLACVWEATARKPGNVHPFRDFENTTYIDFLNSAAVIGPIMDTAYERRVGDTVLHCMQATRAVTRANTNLGIVLLLAPLATVPVAEDLKIGLKGVLGDLNIADSKAVYQAIQLAEPGGLGQVAEQDIRQEPTLPLGEVMALAAERDMVAWQYVTGFRQVFEDGVPAILEALVRQPSISLEEAIIYCQLYLMAKYPDSLIARKLSLAESEEAGKRARHALHKFWENQEARWKELADFDTWLRAKGNRRNPGTTADLVTASLFIALRQGSINLPLSVPFSADRDHG